MAAWDTSAHHLLEQVEADEEGGSGPRHEGGGHGDPGPGVRGHLPGGEWAEVHQEASRGDVPSVHQFCHDVHHQNTQQLSEGASRGEEGDWKYQQALWSGALLSGQDAR